MKQKIKVLIQKWRRQSQALGKKKKLPVGLTHDSITGRMASLEQCANDLEEILEQMEKD